MLAPFEGLIDTAAGPAFVRIEGKGPRCFAFHGGPGFEHSSLRTAISDLSTHREVVYFDQLACGRTPAPAGGELTADATFDHAAAVMDAVGGEFGIVGHSWGAVVAVAAMMRRPQVSATESIFICPSPLDGRGYATAAKAIDERIPTSAKYQMMARLESGASGEEVFAAIQPYYAASHLAGLPAIPVSPSVFFAVSASLGDSFDFSAAMERLGRILLIRSARDFTPAGTIAPLRDRAEIDIELAGVGHFPFHEDPAAFAAALHRVAGDDMADS